MKFFAKLIGLNLERRIEALEQQRDERIKQLTESVVILEQCAMDWVTELERVKTQQAAMASFGFEFAGNERIDVFYVFNKLEERIKTLEARMLELQTGWTNLLCECNANERALYAKISKFFANLAEGPYR